MDPETLKKLRKIVQEANSLEADIERHQAFIDRVVGAKVKSVVLNVVEPADADFFGIEKGDLVTKEIVVDFSNLSHFTVEEAIFVSSTIMNAFISAVSALLREDSQRLDSLE